MAAANNVRLSIDWSPSAPTVARTDATRLKQILFNVVGNAIKFTKGGTVAIRVSANASVLCFEVEDSGSGISPEETIKLFKPYGQGDLGVQKRFRGTGLGLVLSRRLATALSGDLELVRSVPGAGSTFALTLPVAPTASSLGS